MSKRITTIVLMVWFLLATGMFAAKVFGAPYSWWWATIGLWGPSFLILALVMLAVAMMTVTSLINLLSGKKIDLTELQDGEE